MRLEGKMDATKDMFEIASEQTPTGADVTVTAKDGYAIEVGGEYVRDLTVSVERHRLPVRGRRYMLGGRLVKVADWRYDQSGTLWVVTDSGEKVRWDG